MANLNWEVLQKKPKNIISALLKNRGIKNKKEFFNPKSPLDIYFADIDIDGKSLRKTILRITKAIKKKELVVIYGDYDVDGVCATSLLWQALHLIKANAFPFIPDRFAHGYGMSVAGVNKLLETYPNVSLIISVDNGIVAKEALIYCKQKKIDVIVTDHHEKHGEIEAYSVIHSTKVCGTAIAWFLAREIVHDVTFLKESLDLVGFATVSDQMKLVGVNRSLAFHGIIAIQKSRRVGLLALCKISEILIEKVGVYEIGFVLGPRINAAGRLGDALPVVRLLCTNDKSRALEIAADLDELNKNRQEILSEVLLQSSKSDNKNNLIVVTGQFHEGVIGLAAGRLTEATGKPSVVFSVSEKLVKASARSVPGVNITEILRRSEDLLINVGGHEMAAGLSLLPKNLDKYIFKLNEYAKEIDQGLLQKRRKVDCEILLSSVNLELFDDISKLEPFGIGNPKPVFLTHDLTILEVKQMGKKREHVKLVLSDGVKRIDALFFNFPGERNFCEGQKINVVYLIDKNEWNGRSTVQILTRDYIISDEHK